MTDGLSIGGLRRQFSTIGRTSIRTPTLVGREPTVSIASAIEWTLSADEGLEFPLGLAPRLPLLVGLDDHHRVLHRS